MSEGDLPNAFGIVNPQTGRVIMSSIRSTSLAAKLCFFRDYHLAERGFRKAGYVCAPVRVHLLGIRNNGLMVSLAPI